MENKATDSLMTDQNPKGWTVHGWTNYETWNVALYINNEYAIYKTACDWVQDRIRMGYDSLSYDIFRFTLSELFGDKTPDGVSWNDEELDIKELTQMLWELA